MANCHTYGLPEDIEFESNAARHVPATHIESFCGPQHKKIAMGLSLVAGWGAFLREPARKNELIGEYTGELVDQEEAERRCRLNLALNLILRASTQSFYQGLMSLSQGVPI